MAAYAYKELGLTQHGMIGNHRKYGCLAPFRKDDQFFPCGKCPMCKAKRRRDWSFRLGVELDHAISAYFLTMTYDDIHMPRVNGCGTLHKRHTQLFMKRIRNHQRKLISQENKCTLKVADFLVKTVPEYKIKYYLVGEYGDKTRRPHYHALLFNVKREVIENVSSIWKQGHIKVGTVTPESINYCTKYMLKQQFGKRDWRAKPFTTMSRRPAIGMQYLDNADWHKHRDSITVRNTNGNYQAMPRYYRDRIWKDPDERKAVIEAAITEFKENQQKELDRLQAKGKLRPELELSYQADMVRRSKKQLDQNNTL